MRLRTAGMFAATAIAAVVLNGCGPSQESPGAGATPAPAASAKPPFGFLNTPTEREVVKSASRPYFGTGWALAGSGIAQVTATFDDGQKGYVKLGFKFPGVKEQNPSYPDADTAGYMFAFPKMTPGPHSVTVTLQARDGSTTQIQRHFSIP